MSEGISGMLEMKLKPKALHIGFEWGFLGFNSWKRKQKSFIKVVIVQLLHIFCFKTFFVGSSSGICTIYTI